MRNISLNEPLLFVHGPPVFIRVAVTEEDESTSVFVPNGLEFELEEFEDFEEFYERDPEMEEIPVAINPSIAPKIAYLASPFQRQVYRPLQFIVGDETISGEIKQIDGDKVLIAVEKEKDLVVPLDINMIKEILWRGMPFQKD